MKRKAGFKRIALLFLGVMAIAAFFLPQCGRADSAIPSYREEERRIGSIVWITRTYEDGSQIHFLHNEAYAEGVRLWRSGRNNVPIDKIDKLEGNPYNLSGYDLWKSENKQFLDEIGKWSDVAHNLRSNFSDIQRVLDFLMKDEFWDDKYAVGEMEFLGHDFCIGISEIPGALNFYEQYLIYAISQKNLNGISAELWAFKEYLIKTASEAEEERVRALLENMLAAKWGFGDSSAVRMGKLDIHDILDNWENLFSSK